MNDAVPNEENIVAEADIRFAGFWPRFLAYLADNLLAVIVMLPITYYNIVHWKIPYIFLAVSLVLIVYKPFMEYRYGATPGKMLAGLRVVGHGLQKITLSEEMKRVSFYMAPSILMMLFAAPSYFSDEFKNTSDYIAFSEFISQRNPALEWLNYLVVALTAADCTLFFMSPINRSLHDLYAGTYVIERHKN